MRARPLSPHVSIYRLTRYTLITSFANRITGGVLSVGLLALIYWLTCLARGARAYARAQELLGSDLARLVYAAVIAAFAYHLVAGVRHLIWDTGRGFGPSEREWLVAANLIGSIAITVLLWIFVLLTMGVS